MVPNIKEYPTTVHLIHCIGELMNDNRIVDIKTKLDIDLQKEEVKRRDILECLNTASLFGMFLNSIDFRSLGLYADRFILGIKNVHVNKILYYFMNDTWPRDTMQEFLNYNKYPKIEANQEVTKYFVSNKVSHVDKSFRSKIISGFDRLCPYVSSQEISPFEVLVLIYISSLKQMLLDGKIESIPHCNWKLKQTKQFITTGKLNESFLEDKKDRELFDYDNHGFDKFLCIWYQIDKVVFLISRSLYLPVTPQTLIKITTIKITTMIKKMTILRFKTKMTPRTMMTK